MTDKSICAFNWCIYYFNGELSFNEVCCFVINEFSRANIIVIEKDKEIIKIRLPIAYTYAAVVKKLEKKCHYQTLVNINFEEEREIITSKCVTQFD